MGGTAPRPQGATQEMATQGRCPAQRQGKRPRGGPSLLGRLRQPLAPHHCHPWAAASPGACRLHHLASAAARGDGGEKQAGLGFTQQQSGPSPTPAPCHPQWVLSTPGARWRMAASAGHGRLPSLPAPGAPVLPRVPTGTRGLGCFGAGPHSVPAPSGCPRQGLVSWKADGVGVGTWPQPLTSHGVTLGCGHLCRRTPPQGRETAPGRCRWGERRTRSLPVL